MVLLALFGACVFIGAGSWTWQRGWAALVVCLVAEVIINLTLAIGAPETLKQRGSPHDGVKPFDAFFAGAYILLSITLGLVVGMDCVRFGWSSLPWITFGSGVGLIVLSTILGTWAMLENEHFEQFVRIQSDRSHRVITTGPYRYVRHPGYLAAVLGTIAGPLLFGSLWSSVPACLLLALFVWRTHREDATLLEALDGYEDYAEETRYRLFPFVW